MESSEVNFSDVPHLAGVYIGGQVRLYLETPGQIWVQLIGPRGGSKGAIQVKTSDLKKAIQKLELEQSRREIWPDEGDDN